MLGEFLDAQSDPIWLAAPSGAVLWANQAWLAAVEASSVEAAGRRGLNLDGGAQTLAAEAAAAGQARSAVRWVTAAGPSARVPDHRPAPARRRRWRCGRRTSPSSRTPARPCERHVEAHDETLNQISEAVAIFGAGAAPAVPQHRLRRALGPGAGLAGGAAEPRRDARPPAPAPPPARDGGLRRLQGRRADGATRAPVPSPTKSGPCRTGAACAWCASPIPWAACCCCSPTSPAS